MIKSSLYGLLLCGGKSGRMGRDKSLLNYHGEAEAFRMYRMLEKVCARVFLSWSSRNTFYAGPSYSTLTDKTEFEERGPLSGVLTAFKVYPGRNFLVTGCDYPLFSEKDLDGFVASIENESVCKAFYNTDADLYEPLLAYYSAPAGRLLLDSFRRIKSLQQFLQDHHAEKYFPGDQSFIKSVDTPDEALAIRNLIMGTRKTHNT